MKSETPEQNPIKTGSTELAENTIKKKRLKIYGTVAVALVFGIIGSYFLIFSKAATPSTSIQYLTSLSTGQTLNTNEALASSSINPAYRAIMQGDGNLVVYNAGNKPIWQSGTHGTGSNNRLVLQYDGNLVVYTSANKPVWNSRTYSNSGGGVQEKLLMQGDGNLVLYALQNGEKLDKPLWSTRTGLLKYYTKFQLVNGQTLNTNEALASSSINPAYRAIMQGDGNLVVYNAGNKPIWQSGTHGTGSNNRLVLQYDGNLVVYTSANKPVWNSRTYSNAQEQLFMQGDGNLVLYRVTIVGSGTARTPIWSSFTGRLPAPAIPPSTTVRFNSYYCGGSIYPGYHFYQAQSNPLKPNDRDTSGCAGGTIGYVLPTQTEGSVPLYYTRPTSLTRQNTFLTTDYNLAVNTIGIPQGQDNACFTQASTCRPIVIGYVQTSPKPDTTPLYGLYGTDSQTYYFTTSKAEHDTVLRNIQEAGSNHGWSLGIVGYIYTKSLVGGSPAQ